VPAILTIGAVPSSAGAGPLSARSWDSSPCSPSRSSVGTYERGDRIVASLAGALAAIAAYLAVVTLDPRFTGPAYGNDVWFEGDLPRIADEMTHRWAAHSRAPVHPLFSLFACAGVYAMRSLHMSPPYAIAALIALGSACWTILLFLVVRAITPSRGEAVLFTAVGATTAAALFWMTVPETYVFGSATMLAALWMLVLAERRTIPESWFVVVSAGTLAVTVTNWVAGLVVTAARWPRCRALQISVNAFVLAVALWSVQRAIIPRADFFVGYSNEQRYLGRAETRGPARILTVLFAHAIVPPLRTRSTDNITGQGVTTFRSSIRAGCRRQGRHIGAQPRPVGSRLFPPARTRQTKVSAVVVRELVSEFREGWELVARRISIGCAVSDHIVRDHRGR